MTSDYIRIIHLVDLAHRRFMELVQVELSKRLGEPTLSPVQAMVLFNLGDQELTVSEFTNRGCYLGTKVSHNLEKLLEGGWIEKRRSEHDKRAILVRATAKGLSLQERLAATLDAHASELSGSAADGRQCLTDLANGLHRLGEFWRIMSMPPAHRTPTVSD